MESVTTMAMEPLERTVTPPAAEAPMAVEPTEGKVTPTAMESVKTMAMEPLERRVTPPVAEAPMAVEPTEGKVIPPPASGDKVEKEDSSRARGCVAMCGIQTMRQPSAMETARRHDVENVRLR